jgi:hypothetical protein
MTLIHVLELALGIVSFALYHSNAARSDWKKKFQGEVTAHHKTRTALEAAQPAVDRHMRRADEFFNIIQGIEAERDTWKKFYDRASHHAGVAQAWLLRDLHEAVQRANSYAEALRALGKKASDITVSPQLKEIVDEFGLNQEKSAEIKRAPGFEAAQEVEKRQFEPASEEPGPA